MYQKQNLSAQIRTKKSEVRLIVLRSLKVFGVTHKEQNKLKVHANRHRHFNLNSFFVSKSPNFLD